MTSDPHDINVPSAPASRALLSFVVQRLKNAESELRSAGILHAGIFGSVARGDAREDSDVDILVDLDPDAHIGLF